MKLNIQALRRQKQIWRDNQDKPRVSMDRNQAFMAQVMAMLGMVAPVKKTKPKYATLGTYKVPHVFGAQVGMVGARKIIRKYGSQKAIEMYPQLAGAQVKEVEISVIRKIDRSKYKPVRAAA